MVRSAYHEKLESKVPDFNKLVRRAREKGENPRLVIDRIKLEECLLLLQSIQKVREMNAVRIERLSSGRRLNYEVINGLKTPQCLPKIFALGEKYRPYAEELYGKSLELLAGLPGVNINIMPVGGEQGIHIDRCPVTIIVYLTTPEGGEHEVLSGDSPGLVSPEAGTRIALVGADVLFHRVRPVKKPITPNKDSERIAMAFGYGLPGKDYSNRLGEDKILYGNNVDSGPKDQILD